MLSEKTIESCMNHQRAVKEKNYNEILEAMKLDGIDTIKKVSDILGLNPVTVRKYTKEILVKESGFSGTFSKWKYTNSEDRYDYKKTEEGYSDPTAAKALDNLDIYGSKIPGSVWKVQSSKGNDEEYLVIQSYRDCNLCLQVMTGEEGYNKLCCVLINLQEKKYVDCRKLVVKPERYFAESTSGIDAKTFDKVRMKILNVIDIPVQTVEKEVIKEVPVEKIVEKEVIKEVPVEVDNSIDAVDLAILRRERDIYKEDRDFLASVVRLAFSGGEQNV